MTKFAFVFPGQGSQSLGMLDEWLKAYPQIQDTLNSANEAVGFDLAAMISQGPQDALDQTANTQPAMLLADVVIWQCWRAAGGPVPCVVAGHSLGEYAALVAAGSLELADALRLVHQRGQWMQEAVPADAGAMAALIGMSDEAVEDFCTEQAQGQVLQPVNYNAPGQVVIAGEATAVDRALAQAKAAGARMAKKLPVSVPAHSAMMQPVAEKLATALDALPLNAPQIPLLHNLDATQKTDLADIKHAVAQQVCQPVQWVKTLQNMTTDHDIQAGYECGPQQILCGLAKRSIKAIPFKSLASPDKLHAAIQELDQ